MAKDPQPTETSESTPVDAADLAGREIGDFRLLRRIGRGGMADVYLAEQQSLKRRAAVKVLRNDAVADSADVLVRRFRQEAEAAAGLNHPNIVQVYVVGEEAPWHYIAQEFVRGQNLRDFVARKGPPKLSVALHLMKQVAEALQAAGEAGIVHRDIKPENILITRKGQVKVTDFGLARLTDRRDGEPHLTQAGTTVGTPLYMSPEQVSGRDLDPRSDLYSFGATCYFLFCGEPPFQGETSLSIAVQHLNNDPEPLHKRRPDLPRPLCEAIHKMMAKQPADRYSDAQSALEEVKRIIHHVRAHPEAAELSLTDVPVSTRNRSRWFAWPGRRQVLACLGACLLVGSASAGIGWWLRPRNPMALPAQETGTIPKQNSAAAQYLVAVRRDTEAAWKAIIDYFPEAPLETRQAKRQLAAWYLRSRRFAEARELYEEFANFSAGDSVLRAEGLAGMAVIESLQGRYRHSQRILSVRLYPIRDELDVRMKRMVRRALIRNRRHLRGAGDRDLQRRFFPER